MHRHCTLAKELQSLFCGNDFHHPHGKRTLHCILRQKEHANAVIPLFLQRNAGFSRRLFEEGMGHLGEDADPVPYFTGCVFACSVEVAAARRKPRSRARRSTSPAPGFRTC